MGQVIIDGGTALDDLVGNGGIASEGEILLIAVVLDGGAPQLPMHRQDLRDVRALAIHLRGEAQREEDESDAADGHRRDQPKAGVSARLDFHGREFIRLKADTTGFFNNLFHLLAEGEGVEWLGHVSGGAETETALDFGFL